MAQAMATGATSTNTPTATYGLLLLDVETYPTHKALRVFLGADEVPALFFPSADDQAFTARYWLIANAALAGVNADDIALYVAQDIAETEWEAAVKANDLSRVRQLDALIPTLLTDGQREDVQAINATLDEIAAANTASVKQANSKRTFADLNLGQHNTHRARNQKVNFADPSDAQLALLRRCANNGTGYTVCEDGNDERTMRAAALKALGELVYRFVGKRRVVQGFRANGRGLKAVSA